MKPIATEPYWLTSAAMPQFPALTQDLTVDVVIVGAVKRDRFAATEKSQRAIPRGEGRLVELNGEQVAAYRDPQGVVTLRSAVCTHLGCLVAWNGAERTWDCPCHGSRFAPNGDVLGGPAESPLAEVDLTAKVPATRR